MVFPFKKSARKITHLVKYTQGVRFWIQAEQKKEKRHEKNPAIADGVF
jgi:hypothetical protein